MGNISIKFQVYLHLTEEVIEQILEIIKELFLIFSKKKINLIINLLVI